VTIRWGGRATGLAIVALLAGVALTADAAQTARWELVVRAADDEVLLRLPLPDGRFTLRYRNSVYESLAEERFAITPDGRLALVELAADEAAVLAEYYTAAERPRPAETGDARRWLAAPAVPLALDELPLAATEHGRRTLIIDGRQPILLWRLVGVDEPTLTLAAEEPG
jgi:hypothetical protein